MLLLTLSIRAENKFSWWHTLGCYSPNAQQMAAENKVLWHTPHTPGCYFQNAHEMAVENNFSWNALWCYSQNTHVMTLLGVVPKILTSWQQRITLYYMYTGDISKHRRWEQKINFHDDLHSGVVPKMSTTLHLKINSHDDINLSVIIKMNVI